MLLHDATVFGGASGSLLFAWNDASSPSFGLHVSGATGAANNALAFARVGDALRAMGVPMSG